PIFGAQGRALIRSKRRLDAEYGISLLLRQLRNRPDIIRFKFSAHFFSKVPDFICQRTITKLQIMKIDQVFDGPDFEWNANGDTDGAERQQLDHALDAGGSPRTNSLQRRQADHLGPIEKQVARTTFAGVNDELRDRLSEQLAHRPANHLVSDIEAINIDYF